MTAYADTGLLLSLYLSETTTMEAIAALRSVPAPLPLTPLGLLELRNGLNLAVYRERITAAEHATVWQRVEQQIAAGVFVPTPLPAATLHARARELSDRHTATGGTRTLDIIHVAAALLLNAREFLSFDDRQRRMAKAEGLRVKP